MRHLLVLHPCSFVSGYPTESPKDKNIDRPTPSKKERVDRYWIFVFSERPEAGRRLWFGTCIWLPALQPTSERPYGRMLVCHTLFLPIHCVTVLKALCHCHPHQYPIRSTTAANNSHTMYTSHWTLLTLHARKPLRHPLLASYTVRDS